MATKALAQFGMIGLGVMGRNLALNINDRGFPIAVWNYEPEWVDEFLSNNPKREIVGTKTFEDFVRSIERPRRIMMMIKDGAQDITIQKLAPLLDKGDIIIDGGNSWFKDTQRREQELTAKGLNFFGCGVSGGEEGARNGPSLMPGGKKEAYERVRPVFEAIAATTDSGKCVTYVGPDGAGHFVKMVHNGIEYGDMQLIAESYDLLRRGGGMEAAELADVFAEWNRGPLESFLIEITSNIFRAKDPDTGKPLVDLVLDKAGQKGTGKWTAQVALDLGVSIPTIAAAIDARVLSSMKEERVEASRRICHPEESKQRAEKQSPAERHAAAAAATIQRDRKEHLVKDVHDALYASKVCAYAQGMSLIRAGSDQFKWNINLGELARIWKGGCIIRARFLDSIMQAFAKNPALTNLLLDDAFCQSIANAEAAWRRTVSFAQQQGIPVPAMSGSLAYFDSYRTANLPQNLTQAQRDYFGAHTYQRADKPGSGFVHSEWTKLAE